MPHPLSYFTLLRVLREIVLQAKYAKHKRIRVLCQAHCLFVNKHKHNVFIVFWMTEVRFLSSCYQSGSREKSALLLVVSMSLVIKIQSTCRYIYICENCLQKTGLGRIQWDDSIQRIGSALASFYNVAELCKYCFVLSQKNKCFQDLKLHGCAEVFKVDLTANRQQNKRKEIVNVRWLFFVGYWFCRKLFSQSMNLNVNENICWYCTNVHKILKSTNSSA